MPCGFLGVYGSSLTRGSDDLFHSRIDQMIDLRHPLAVLASHMPWQEIEASLAKQLAREVKKGRSIQALCVNINLSQLNLS